MLSLKQYLPQTDSTSVSNTSTSTPPTTDTPLLLQDFLGREELARELGVSARTVDRLHRLRQGPPRVCFGRKILYDIRSVREWLRSREQRFPANLKRQRFDP